MWHMSQAMKEALKNDHTVATKVVLLDTEFREVADDTIFSAEDTNEITNFISDGNIDVDTERATRRTAELTLLNPNDEFTPATEDFHPEGPWVGKIYLNRLVRIYRGLYTGSHRSVPEYVPVGTFMIDKTNVIVERNMSLVNLTMSDLWKKGSKSYADRAYNFAANSWYNDIIETLINDAGMYHPRLMPAIDPLNGRANDDKKTSKVLTMEEGDSRGDFLKELVTTWDIDMYMNPLGQFVTEDRKSARDKQNVWTFGLETNPNRDGLLISVNREFSDDNLYNHVIVIGGEDKNIIRREKADTAANSKTNIALIGDRVWLLKDDKLNTANKVQAALDRAWAVRFQMSELIQLETISNPALEGDDVIKIVDRQWAKVDGTYRLKRFTVPLMSSRQDIQAANIVYEGDL